jgi:hypothetical protein
MTTDIKPLPSTRLADEPPAGEPTALPFEAQLAGYERQLIARCPRTDLGAGNGLEIVLVTGTNYSTLAVVRIRPGARPTTVAIRANEFDALRRGLEVVERHARDRLVAARAPKPPRFRERDDAPPPRPGQPRGKATP